jgi:hypothetical protein
MKYILLFCFALFFLAGCKKSNSSAESYYRMTINGLRVPCDNGIRANKTTTQNNLLYIDGQWSAGGLRIEIFNFANTAGTWMVNPNFGSSPRFTLFEGQIQYDAGDGGFNGGQLGSGKVIILEISDEFIKGTFEFTSSPSLFTNMSRTVTQGEFQVTKRL